MTWLDDCALTGYLEGADWAARMATRAELLALIDRCSGDGRTYFVWSDHSLAAYWGLAAAAHDCDGPVGDVNPYEPWGGGFLLGAVDHLRGGPDFDESMDYIGWRPYLGDDEGDAP